LRKTQQFKKTPINNLKPDVETAMLKLREQQPFTLVSDTTYRRVLAMEYAPIEVQPEEEVHREELREEQDVVEKSRRGATGRAAGDVVWKNTPWLSRAVARGVGRVVDRLRVGIKK